MTIKAVGTTARTPNYTGTTTAEWSKPTFNECVAGYYKNSGASKPDDEVNDVGEAPQAMRNWIASLSLLGNADAETFSELLYFPVVDPSSMNLHKTALEAVISGRGSQADAPDTAVESARKKAYQLLVKEFDYENDDVPEEYKSVHFGEQFAEKLIEKADEIRSD